MRVSRKDTVEVNVVYVIVKILTKQKQPLEAFCKKGVLGNFTKFTGKHLCQSLFFKKETLSKERLWHRYFHVNFAKFVRIPLLAEHLRWLLLYQTVLIYQRTYQYPLTIFAPCLMFACASGLQLYHKKDSGAGVFLWILRNLQELLFYGTIPVAASVWNSLNTSTNLPTSTDDIYSKKQKANEQTNRENLCWRSILLEYRDDD